MADKKPGDGLVASCPICIDGVPFAAGDSLADVSAGTVESMVSMGQAVTEKEFKAAAAEVDAAEKESAARRNKADREPVNK